VIRLVITFVQVTLNLEPLFKRSLTYLIKDDSDLGDELASFGRKHEFADVTWYPSQQKAVYRIDDRVSVNTSGNGLYDFFPFRPTLSAALTVVRATGLCIFLPRYIHTVMMYLIYTI